MATIVKMGDTPKDGPKYQVVRGFKFAPTFPNVEDGLDYKAKPDDWFIVTYPKNGTTWIQQIVVLILNKGELPDVVKESGLYSLSPFLEMNRKSVEDMVRPGVIKTHLPYSLQPKHPDAKYIVIIRNPKDACVSFYYHQTMFPAYEFQNRSFHDFLPFWLNGEVECGDYFDWILSWWKHRGDTHILFLFFEDMKANPRSNILKVAEFLGDDHKNFLMDNDCEILEKVVKRSSFQYMKEVINTAGAKRAS